MILSYLFNPASIAIIGASHETNKVGYLTAKNIIDQGYKGELYLINHQYKGKILGKTVYPSLTDIGKPIDLVIMAVPGKITFSILGEMAKLKIKNTVIYAAGFKETGKDGEILEKELLDKAKKHNINILGPNCIGFVNAQLGINATFLKNAAPKGNIGFISQSGALGSYLCDYFSGHSNLGFSYFISLGNKTVIDESDVLEFLANDKDTDVIGMYLEDIKDGDKFRQTVRAVGHKKPIIILKSGATFEGSKAALSHTGGMIGDDQVYETVFRQLGIIRAKTMGEFLTIFKLFSYKKLPTEKSVLVLSNAGGAGVLLTDELIKNNLTLTTISEEIKKDIQRSFKNTKKVSVNNPIDLLGDASAFDYKTVIEKTIREKNIGSIIVLLTPQANTEIFKTAEVIVKIQNQFSHPIYPIFMGKKSMMGIGKLFEKNKIAGFANFDFLPKAIAQIIWQKETAKKKDDKLETVLLRLESSRDRQMSDVKTHMRAAGLMDSLRMIESAGIDVEPLFLVTSVNDLKKITDKTGFPVVAKIVSDKISHKTDVGGVVTSIKTLDELKLAYDKLSHCLNTMRQTGKVGVQKMIKGSEILVGAKRDKTFGPVIIFGLGGIYTELLKEISYLVYPFTYEQFKEKINESKLGKIARGFRNNSPINLLNLYEVIDKLGNLMIKKKEINEIDINPLIASEKKILAIDARVIF